MNKQALVDYLISLQADMESRFNNDICDTWYFDGFMEHIDNCIGDIMNEIEADEEAENLQEDQDLNKKMLIFKYYKK